MLSLKNKLALPNFHAWTFATSAALALSVTFAVPAELHAAVLSVRSMGFVLLTLFFFRLIETSRTSNTDVCRPIVTRANVAWTLAGLLGFLLSMIGEAVL